MIAKETFTFRHGYEIADNNTKLALHTKLHTTSRHNLEIGNTKKIVRVDVFRKVNLGVLRRARLNEFTKAR